jgi:hypothetical protein
MAQADKLKVGVGLICDGSNQVERYLKLSRGEGSPVEALKVVNDEANKTACGVASIAFVVGEEVGTVKLKDGVMHIMQIMVVATQTQRGWQQVPPTVQYTAVFEKFEEV